MKRSLFTLLLLAACTTQPAPDPTALDPDESRSDARIEGIWQREDGMTLFLNDDGTLRVENDPPLQGERWDYFDDSLALYLQPTGQGTVDVHMFHVDTLGITTLVLRPTEVFGGHYSRRMP